jgi:hypothetical protein
MIKGQLSVIFKKFICPTSIIGTLDDFFFVFECVKYSDRTKNFFFIDFCIFFDIGQKRRLDESALVKSTHQISHSLQRVCLDHFIAKPIPTDDHFATI